MDEASTTMGPGPHRLAGSGAGTRRTCLPRIASLAFPAGGVPGAAPAGPGREPLRAAHAAGEPGTGIWGGARLLGAALAGLAIVVSVGSASTAAHGILPDPAPVRSAAFPAPAPGASPATSDAAAGTLPGGWRLLRMSYHGTGRPKDANDELWRREIANLSAGRGGQLPIYEASFPDGNTTVLLSITGQGGSVCDNGPNDADSKRDYAICPGKLVLLQDGRPVATRSVGRTCVEVINEGGVRPGAPGWQDPRLWGTRARYAAAAGTIELMTLQQGRPERACTKTLQVR